MDFDDASFIRELGQRIFRHRQSVRLTVPEVATLTGIDPTRLTGIERGTHEASMGEFVRLAKALKVAPAVLMAEPGPDESSEVPIST